MTCTGGLCPAAGASVTGAKAGASIPGELPDAVEEDGALGGEVCVGTVAGVSATISRADVEIARAVSGDTRNNAFVWLFAS